MSVGCFVVSILSGKGGVGKTTIALNLAKQLSHRGATWLIDIDLFNRGATSALWESENELPLSVAELILLPEWNAGARTDAPIASDALLDRLASARPALAYDRHLIFLPAARAIEGRRASYVLWHGLPKQGYSAVEFLDALVAACARLTPGCVIVLDGHGGLDELSVAAALISDTCYIVNEPDLITFTGSVTLFREVREQGRQAAREPWIEFLVNRVSPTRGVVELDIAFGPMLDTMSPAAEAVAIYFPLEPELFGVFGDDPFVAELYTEYWFSRKVAYLADRVAEAGISAGALPATEEWKGTGGVRQPHVRTATRRELHKRGDVLLLGWLSTVVALLVGWVWVLLRDQGTVSPGPPSLLWIAAAGLLLGLLVETARWVGVQRTHVVNIRRLRGRAGRRLRLAESESARLRERVEGVAKARTALRPLVLAASALFFSAVIAAVAIPNMLNTVQRGKVKRTMGELRTVSTALESYAIDYGGYPPADAGARASALRSLLEPTYIKVLPATDGWGHDFRYQAWPGESGRLEHYALLGPGNDGEFTHLDARRYEPGTTTSFGADVVFEDGRFVVSPEGVQQ